MEKKEVMSQPNIPAKWNPRILDCCIDRRVCLCGTFCSMCLACQMVERYGECLSPPAANNYDDDDAHINEREIQHPGQLN
uniref:Uncharacterized protein n=1 Tax=Salmo trutta TaxID=8032 RepID=A0A673ZBF9_SALTR